MFLLNFSISSPQLERSSVTLESDSRENTKVEKMSLRSWEDMEARSLEDREARAKGSTGVSRERSCSP